MSGVLNFKEGRPATKWAPRASIIVREEQNSSNFAMIAFTVNSSGDNFLTVSIKNFGKRDARDVARISQKVDIFYKIIFNASGEMVVNINGVELKEKGRMAANYMVNVGCSSALVEFKSLYPSIH